MVDTVVEVDSQDQWDRQVFLDQWVHQESEDQPVTMVWMDSQGTPAGKETKDRWEHQVYELLTS